ncbi:MAG: DUF3786 domain-containing protein [Syntrophales bacterium]|nr:DUF3786 domain-containing protein [Syntrophales bacterium]MDD5642582.1 DUF3786 domain-containing protein [Syntrophales bacterium]
MPRVDDYKAAIALAVAELKKINPQRLSGLSRCEYFYEDTREWLIVPFFGQGRMVSWPEVSVTPAQGEGDISLTEQILILHYLLNATGEPLGGREIDFRNVPEGGFYWSAFVSRAKKPLLETFGQDLDLYREVAATLGGTPRDLGDASATFMAFPLVPVTHVLWHGDEEFPPEANILFDDTISQHLSTEDIAALAGSSVYRLMGAAYKMRKSH